MKLINNTEDNNIIIDLKKNSDPEMILDIFVAYISVKGLYEIIDELLPCYKNINIFVGKRSVQSTKIISNNKDIKLSKAHQYINKNSSNINILDNIENIKYETKIDEELKSGKVKIYSMLHKLKEVENSKRDDIFHGKVYITSKDSMSNSFYIGSHNLTNNAHFPITEEGNYLANEISLKVSDVDLTFFHEIKENNSEYYSLKRISNINELLDDNNVKGDYFYRLATNFRANQLKVNPNKKYKDFEFIHPKIPFWKKLAEHQKEAVKFIYENLEVDGGSFLSLPTGMGKTWVSLTILYINTVIKRSYGSVLILVPNKKLLKQWESDWDKLTELTDARETDDVRKQLSVEDFVESYNGKAFDNSKDDDAKSKMSGKIKRASLIIIEESHNLRNKSGISHRKSTLEFLLDFIKDSRYDDEDHPAVLLVTATPINNGLRDLMHQVEIFPTRYKNSEVKKEVIPKISKLIEIFDEKKKEYERVKSVSKSSDSFDSKKSQEIIGEKWSEIVNDAFSDNDDYNHYSSFLNSYIYKGKKEQVIDPKFLPENDVPEDYINNHVAEGTYKVSKTEVDNIINAIEKFKIEEEVGIFGTAPSADTLFVMNIFKAFESSPAAALTLVEDFIKKWTVASENEEELIKYIEKQINAEFRSRINNRIDTDSVTDEADDIEYEIELKKENKIADKKIWIEENFLSEKNRQVYNEIILNLKSLIIDIDNINLIDEKFFDDNPKFEKEKLLYYDLKSQLITTGDLEGYYNKTLIFAYYKETIRYLNKLISKFDFIIDYSNFLGEDISEIVFDANETNISKVNEFSPLSRVKHESDKYRRYRDNTEKLIEIDKNSLKHSIMLATDLWAEGHNLQDATMLISYDTHWNPMRVIQRVGRIIRILTPELSHHIYDRLNAKKKIRYYWMKPDKRVISDFIDLNKIVSFKMMQIISSGFKYPITFNKLMENDDERVRRIRNIIATQTKGGSDELNEDILLEKRANIFGVDFDDYKYHKNTFDLKVKENYSDKDKIDELYNGTIVISEKEIFAEDKLEIHIILEANDNFYSVVLFKDSGKYSIIDEAIINNDIYSNGESISHIYETTRDGFVVGSKKANFLINDEEVIKEKCFEALEQHNENITLHKELAKYYSIYIRERNEK